MLDFDVRAGYLEAVGEPEMLADLSGVHALRDELGAPIGTVPRRSPVIVAPDRPLRETVTLMADQHVGAALVVSHGVLLGILTEREIMRRLLLQPATGADAPVWKVMTTDPDTLLDSDTVGYAVRKLRALGVRAMPILQPNGSLRGLFGTHDVVAWLCERMTAGGILAPGNV
jgi:CBS domain-containing protein